MIDATGVPQRVLLLGGTSDLGLAIVRRMLPADRRIAVVLAGRDQVALREVSDGLGGPDVHASTVAFDAEDIMGHEATVAAAWADGDVDVAILAFGQLGDQRGLLDDPVGAARLVAVNHAGAVSVGLRVAARMRAQGHGHIIALSSIAAERARPGNFIYGATKAGFDAFFDGLGYELAPHGVTVAVLRPGFVPTAMTQGLDTPPLAATPDDVARAAVQSIGRTGARYTAVPHGVLGRVLRLAPRSIIRRLP